MVKGPLYKSIFGLIVLMFMFLTVPVVFAADNLSNILEKGDRAFLRADYEAAEKLYKQAEQMESDNYRILKSLAETQLKLGKFVEAENPVDRVLAMPHGTGRDILVYLKGKSQPLEAELVDETVVTPETGQNNMRNYVDAERSAAIPHYRFFFKKAGKLQLVPKYKARIKYTSVLNRDYEMVKDMKVRIINTLMARLDGGKIQMVNIPAGCFQMGSIQGDNDEKPVREVCISPFKMDKYEVTQKAFLATMGSNPSQFPSPDNPVESVTWYEANAYCKKIGKRLPTEAEWEYAARAGSNTAYYWGDKIDGQYANFCDSKCNLNSRASDVTDGYKFTAPIGSFKPNQFGLYDMAGNVTEWTSDFMRENYYSYAPKDNPPGPEMQKVRKVFRGGAWNTDAGEVRLANRNSIVPNYRPPSMGVRCVKDPKSFATSINPDKLQGYFP